MTSNTLEEFDVIEELQVDGADLIVVGEHHSSDHSASLVRRVLRAKEPEAVCIEASPAQWQILEGHAPSKGGEAAQTYAEDVGIPVYLIDEEQEQIAEAFVDADKQRTSEEDGMRPPEPDERGDIDESVLRKYREKTKEEQSDRYRVMWERREKAMKQRLRGVLEEHDNEVCVVGASHVSGIADDFESVEAQSVTESRVMD